MPVTFTQVEFVATEPSPYHAVADSYLQVLETKAAIRRTLLLDTRRLSNMKIISCVFFIASFVGFALGGEWNCADTSGVFTQSTDCTVSSQIVVTGTLNITGIPDANGVLPKVIGGGSNRLFKVQSGGKLVVKYLNLTGGRKSGSEDDGGAILCTGTNSTLIVDASIFSNNLANGYGGAIAVEASAETKILNSNFTGNTALDHGGAVSVRDSESSINVTQTSFFDNEATGTIGVGGAIYAVFSIVILQDCIFFNNNAQILFKSLIIFVPYLLLF